MMRTGSQTHLSGDTRNGRSSKAHRTSLAARRPRAPNRPFQPLPTGWVSSLKMVSPQASTKAASHSRHRVASDRDHLRHVARQPCLICGRKPSDPHHLRHLQPRALGRKVSDEFSVPLCRIHHRLVHRVGNEAAWWQDRGIDPLKVARKLWGETRRAEGRKELSAPLFEPSPSPADPPRLSPPAGTESRPG